MNMRGLLRQNWAKFSSVTILPPNTPCSQLGPEKRYGVGLVKKLRPKTCLLGWTKLRSGTLLPLITQSSPFGQENRWGAYSTKIQTENVFFGKTNLRGLFRQNWAKFSSGTIQPPNVPYSQWGPEKRYGAGFIKKLQSKTYFFGCTNLHSGTILPPTVPSSPFGLENRWGAI